MAKLEYLASGSIASKLHRLYDGLYMGGVGSTFSLHLDRDNARSINAVERSARRRYPGIEHGLDPEVTLGDKPRLHRMQRLGDKLLIEYVEAGRPLQILDATYHSTMYSPLRFRRIALGENPFTTEVRGTMATADRNQLLELVNDDLGLHLSESFVRCDVSTPSKFEALKASLNATSYGQRDLGRGTGLGHAEIFTNRNVALEELPEYQERQARAAEREPFLLAWLFSTEHLDGYDEQAYYVIRLGNGDLAVSRGISEKAIEKLRQHVVALF